MFLVGALVGSMGCSSPEPTHVAAAATELKALIDLAATDLQRTAFPSEHFRNREGTLNLESLGPRTHPIFQHVIAGLSLRDGFGITTGALFPLSAPIANAREIEARTVDENVASDASVYLVDIDLGIRAPMSMHFVEDAGAYGAPNTLAMMPLQGAPLAVDHLHAAVVLRRAVVPRDARLPIQAWDWSSERTRVCAAECPSFVPDYDRAWDFVQRSLAANDRVFAFTVFRTGNPRRLVEARLQAARAHEIRGHDEPVLVIEEPEYCGFETRVSVPVFQRGTPPYNESGGDVLSADGALQEVAREDARVFFSIPRNPATTAMHTAILVRAGAGADRALFDRGVVHETNGVPEPGRGIAVHLARAGYAGVSIDGPQGGIRSRTAEEQYTFFAITNQRAMTGNLEQAALELSLLPRWLRAATWSSASCSEAMRAIHFDAEHLVLIGHSTGASIAPLAAAYMTDVDAVVLSGAGGSFAANLMFKESPLVVRPLVAGLLGIPSETMSLGHPALQLFQWAAEHVDTQVFAEQVAWPTPQTPRDTLVFQGIVDSYILPPIANALQGAMRIDQGGEFLDHVSSRLHSFAPLSDFLARNQRQLLPLPIHNNLRAEGSEATGAVVQFAEDGIQNGHEVFWQRADAHSMLRCFLRSHLRGNTVIAADCE